MDDPVSPSGSLRIDLGGNKLFFLSKTWITDNFLLFFYLTEESDHVSKMTTALQRTDISPTDNRDKPEHKSSDGDSSPEISSF